MLNSIIGVRWTLCGVTALHRQRAKFLAQIKRRFEMAGLYQHNHVGKIKETVRVVFENGYSIVLEAGVETSMSLTMYEGAKNTEQANHPDSGK